MLSRFFALTCLIVATSLASGADHQQATSDARPLIAIMVAENEYETSETLPKFAARCLEKDYRVEYLSEDPAAENTIVDIERLTDADLLLVSVRRKTLPTSQLQVVRDFVAAGKPVVGIRTASHAFSLRGKAAPQGLDQWLQFDAEVFGGNYSNHHSNKKASTIASLDAAKEHPILAGIAGKTFSQGGSLYKTSPLAAGATALLMGQLQEEPDVPPEPVAWTFERAGGGRSFYTSLGHRTDFENPVFRRLLRQAIDWALQRPASAEDCVCSDERN